MKSFNSKLFIALTAALRWWSVFLCSGSAVWKDSRLFLCWRTSADIWNTWLAVFTAAAWLDQTWRRETWGKDGNNENIVVIWEIHFSGIALSPISTNQLNLNSYMLLLFLTPHLVGLHDISHAIVMRISSVKLVIWLVIKLCHVHSDGAFNTQSRSSLSSYAISRSALQAIHLWLWALIVKEHLFWKKSPGRPQCFCLQQQIYKWFSLRIWEHPCLVKRKKKKKNDWATEE